jgi:hypothetical protein
MTKIQPSDSYEVIWASKKGKKYDWKQYHMLTQRQQWRGISNSESIYLFM